MPDYVTRAAFFEGQVISAADLNLTISYDRDAMARHLRQQHTWGIVDGLELTGAARTTAAATGSKPYVEVTLAVGAAVDGTGRVIIVTEPTRLQEGTFDETGVAISDPAAFYPVFLSGPDRESQDAAGPAGACQLAAANRIQETFDISFARMSALTDLDAQQSLEVTDGPGGATSTPWRVLLGFVQWDDSIKRFTKVEPAADGFERRYAGVRAGEVVAPAGQLALRTATPATGGAPVMQLSAGKKNLLEFGPQAVGGKVQPVMTVDTDGNLTVTGKIVGALAGGVMVQSGIASDGLLLPLPPGVTQKQINDGEVVVQAQVTPRYQIPSGFPDAEKWFPHFYECRVDARRVRCRVRWISTIAMAPAPQDLPGACDYVLMAFPKKDGA